MLNDAAADTLFVLTRHSSHARYALQGLAAGKHVFVEKPLALTGEELDALETAVQQSSGLLTVGFNRRFAPYTTKLRQALSGRGGPVSIIMTINAGALPSTHWTRDREVGGGRIAGEGCHFIDLARAIVGSPIVDGHATTATSKDGEPIDDVAHLTLRFADGSTAAIHYLSNGASAFPKERIDVFCGGRTFTIDNWKKFVEHGVRTPLFGGSGQDKGHVAEMKEWLRAVRDGGPPPIPYEELFEVSRWTLRLAGTI